MSLKNRPRHEIVIAGSKSGDGLWLAYSRWPNKAMRDAAWPGDNALSAEFPEEVRQAIQKIQRFK